MISITKLLCGTPTHGDRLRYGEQHDRKPIVVWNCTRRCNLRCVHCYADATTAPAADEMTGAEGAAFIHQLADFRVPVLLFSGGEPLMQPHLFAWAEHARTLGLRTVLSTNGTLITPEVARRLRDAGFSYVGISLDGMGEVNDRFRGVAGAFNRALGGLRACLSAGLPTGLRLTMTTHNAGQIPDLFDLMDAEDVDRICFYHLAYAGRGLPGDDLSHADTRRWVEYLFDRTLAQHGAGHRREVLTVDNHADGVLLYQRVLREYPHRAAEVAELLKRNGGNGSGITIAAVDWHGEVHPDQFTTRHTVGNVRQRRFGEIWSDHNHPLLAALRNRRKWLTGRCAACRWLDFCNGNLRARAESATGNFWASDPGCYLTDEEIR